MKIKIAKTDAGSDYVCSYSSIKKAIYVEQKFNFVKKKKNNNNVDITKFLIGPGKLLFVSEVEREKVGGRRNYIFTEK